MSDNPRTHLNERGEARMVDVTAKEVTTRSATARCRVTVSDEVAGLLRSGQMPKGDALAVARIAAIQATKRTPDLIPLCHPIAVHGVDATVVDGTDGAEVEIVTTVRTADRTGVEMEALTAAAVGGLTVIDMVKGAPAVCSHPGGRAAGEARRTLRSLDPRAVSYALPSRHHRHPPAPLPVCGPDTLRPDRRRGASRTRHDGWVTRWWSPTASSSARGPPSGPSPTASTSSSRPEARATPRMT